jgi:aspartate aminotransferase
VSISDDVRKRMAEGSPIRKMFEEGIALKKRFGDENVFDLSIGNPVMEPPPEFDAELQRLANNPLPGMHRYMENAGYVETRSAVAEYLSNKTKMKFSNNDIVMTCGAAGALNVVFKTILNKGDEVIVFAPYFVEFDNYINNHGGITKVLPTDNNFIPLLDVLETEISAKTKAIIINSPNNPTGVVYDEQFIHNLGELLHKKEKQFNTQIYLINDEAYSKIIYEGVKLPLLFQHYNQSITVTSHSKDLGLPGERIGYIAINPTCINHDDMVAGFIFCNRVLGFINAPALMQRAVGKLLNVSVSIKEYQDKRDFLYTNLVALGYKMMKPQGTFYMFPQSPIDDDVDFVKQLQAINVLTVPGQSFGARGYFRIAFCVNTKTLEGSLLGFKKAAKKFGLC